MVGIQKTSLPYNQARPDIRTGALLLWRGRGIVSKFIRVAGRSKYSHAGMAMWVHGILLCLEVREFAGGRAVTLSSQVRRFPSQIDVFNPNPAFEQFDAIGAARAMLRKSGNEYSYGGIALASLIHLPVVRLYFEPGDDEEGGSDITPEYCSMAISDAAKRGGGEDPVPNLGNAWTEPGDLARSKLWDYFCTLDGDEREAAKAAA